MPAYPYRCLDCGHERDFWMSMDEVRSDRVFFCAKCGRETMRRFYTPPADLSENTFKPRWDDQLSRTADPVYVSSRREERRLMESLGVRPLERGDADTIRKNAIRRRREADEKLRKQVGDVCDKAFDKAVAAF